MDKELMSLAERFGSDAVSFERGKENMAVIYVHNEFAEARIALHGAHVMEFKPVGEEPVLWMSEKSDFSPTGAIRGGIPVCWPWFGAHPTDPGMPGHGYARRCDWHLNAVEKCANGATRLILALSDADVPAEYGAPAFELVYTVIVGDVLECQLAMRNLSDNDFPISAALHTYFNVGAVEQIAVVGLEDMEFEDTLDHTFHTETEPVEIDREVDRRYVDNGQMAAVVDPVLKRSLAVEKHNSYSSVVWNPWIEKSKRMPDFGDDEYHTMVCLETCNCGADARVVKPGEGYSFGCKITLVK